MPDFSSFQPSIEVSRGCGSKCSFCLERDMPLMKLKDVNQITREIINTKKVYGKEDITPYFEASVFRPTLSWAKDLNSSFKENNLSVKWRAETRADSLKNEEILAILAETGLKVLDIGLETASPIQINRMKKSTNPDKYLTEASNLLKVCRKLNIWGKVNILLYAGESKNTLKETTDWLEEHRACIKGVSVNPLFVYGHDNNTIRYIEELKLLGAKPTDDNFRNRGYSQMHLSPDISFDDSENIRIEISQSFMADDYYYDLKSFSYLPPSLTKDKFKEIIRNANSDTFPFKRT
ncbi:hopanoid biosynthesis associated radical SAM protein HpnJ [Bacteroidales bacterium Barb6]|nr:hopanoid biosynthesis associated radical SAM protein HpnJ [Bacteroidales bacterium Barb6]